MSTQLAGDSLHRDSYSVDERLRRRVSSDFSRGAMGADMTREEAYSRCPADSYVERYGSQWLIVPFAPVEQPRFFVCQPEGQSLSA